MSGQAISDHEQTAVQIVAKLSDGTTAVGARVGIFLDGEYAGTVIVSSESIPTVLFPKSVRYVWAIARYREQRAERIIASDTRILTLTLEPDAGPPRDDREQYLEWNLPGKSTGRPATGYQSVNGPPQARCPDGTTGYPCVKCIVGGNQITICV